MVKKVFVLIFLCGFSQHVFAQFFQNQKEFTRQDTLRGSITQERAWWDVTYYHLDVTVNLKDSTIFGSNLVQYRVDSSTTNRMQIDLQPPMEVLEVTQSGQVLEVEKEGNAWFITLIDDQEVGEIKELEVEFGGKPLVAARPPWDGGITWARDQNGKPFIANANQKIGASIWWPNKDHPYDEVDSMLISVTIPEDLVDVSNGRLRSVNENSDGTKTWNWFVSNPINSYGVNINIGDYENFKEMYEGEAGELDMDYWVLSYNKEKAIAQFAEAPRTMEALEYWFGPYPFYEDSYKLVEAPYLGMEHQSSVTYGNRYENGYLGTDLSASGWGLKFDFIIVHETGHEWFANSITYADIADMWIHESFTHYSEYLFLEYHFGKKAASEYQKGVRLRISNDIPIIGNYGVHSEGSGDMYYKGGNMLHLIRQIFNNDALWRETLRGLNEEFYHQTVSTQQIEDYISDKLGRDLTPVFDQYLRDARIPILEYSFKEGNLLYRWGNAVPGFNAPVDVVLDGKEIRLTPTTGWQGMESFGKELTVDPDFYIGSMNVLGD
ncbi:MAG: M1 family metallopeptidase [Balneolaceae bacterium]|nr:M1 family metallopeptidase [Balneolaceae bacterium]MBO6546889.1 M1 family metallopeptidase [Balneolaceae bacterium]MBO6649249.1 M1 family metallopeptidase [Balneolaceae bacterium]